jgi:hypothetical protein
MPRLKVEKLSTKRPDDYYAQMAKSDEHMEKVKQFFFWISEKTCFFRFENI